MQAKDLLLERAYGWEQQRGDNVFMTQPIGNGAVREYTWKQSLDEARRMAAHLSGLGYEPGSRIAILAKNSAHFVLADLTIWMAGHVSVALYPTLNAETVRYTLDHSEAKLLFIGKLDTWQQMAPGVPEAMPRIRFPLSPQLDCPDWDEIVSRTEPIEGSPVRDADDMAIIVYTSGSTGKPKGAVHSFRTMSAAGNGFSEVFHFTPADRMISYLPLAHAFERACVETTALLCGIQLFFAESLDTFVQDLQRARPTVFHSVPRLWLKFQAGVFAKMPEKKLARLLRIPILSGIVKRKVLTGLGLQDARMAISGSAPIPPELIRWYQALGLELLEGYGMTENFAYSHVSLPGRSRPGYVGNSVPRVETRISEQGEVLVKSPGSMLGYYKEPEMTQESFTEDGFLKTGDRGELDGDGRLRITGRVKELFKTSKGKYIAPAPIENLLNASALIEQSCVTGAGQPQPHAVVTLSESARKAAANDRTRLVEQLAGLLTEVNRQVEPFEQLGFLAIAKDDWQIENGFLTPTMKIKRSVIEGTYGSHISGWAAANQKVIWQQ